MSMYKLIITVDLPSSLIIPMAISLFFSSFISCIFKCLLDKIHALGCLDLF